MVSSKFDGRTARVTIGLKFDRIGDTTEKSPASALTDRDRDQLAEGVDMSDSTDTRKAIALDYLKKVADDLTRAASLRVQYVLNAREYGATNQQIGDALGITETAVRRMVTRHGGTPALDPGHVADRADIAQIASQFTFLFPAGDGSRYVGECPITEGCGTTFQVMDQHGRGYYFCDQCGAAGDVFSLVQAVMGTEFRAAVSYVAGTL